MIPPADLDQLEVALAEECRELERLSHAMEREQAAISAGLAEAITRCAQEKEASASNIARLAARRKTLLSEAGFADGMAGLLRHLPVANKIHAAWQRVQVRASKAEQLNHTSGILLGLHAAQLNARIGAFMAAVAPAATYSPGGTYPLRGQRALGAA